MSCILCDWYEVAQENEFNARNTKGKCKRYPPMLYIGADGLRRSDWPGVDETDYCGELSMRYQPND